MGYHISHIERQQAARDWQPVSSKMPILLDAPCFEEGQLQYSMGHCICIRTREPSAAYGKLHMNGTITM